MVKIVISCALKIKRPTRAPMGPYTAANMIGDGKKPNFWLNIERQGPHI